MTSVNNDINKVSGGSYTLYTDATMDANGRPFVVRRGSVEFYRNQTAEAGGENNPNLGQAPGCPGSLPESAQKVEELSRQLNDANRQISDFQLREDKLRQTITDLTSHDKQLNQSDKQPAYSPQHHQSEVGLHGQHQGRELNHLRVTPGRDFMPFHVAEVPSEGQTVLTTPPLPRPHRTHGYVNVGGMSTQPEEGVEENVKDGHIKHLQRQVTVLQSNLYKAEENRNRASEAMKERDAAIDRVRHLSDQLAGACEENESLKHETESHRKNFILIQQKLASANQDLDVARSRLTEHDHMTHEMARLREENQALKLSLTRLNQENGRLRETNSTATGSSDQSMSGLSSACSSELTYLHQVVDTLKRTVLEQRKFLVGMKENPSSINGHSGSESVTSSTETHRNPGIPASPVRNPGEFAPPVEFRHSGQGDSNLARQKPRLAAQEKVFHADSTHDLHKHSSQSVSSKDSGISSSRSSTANTSASVSASSISSADKKNVTQAPPRPPGAQPPARPPVARKTSQTETFAVRRSEQALNLSQGGSRSAMIASQPRPPVSLDAKPRPLQPTAGSFPRQPITTTPRRAVAYEAAFMPPESPRSPRRPDSNQNSSFAVTGGELSGGGRPGTETGYRPQDGYRCVNPDLMAGGLMMADSRPEGYVNQYVIPQSSHPSHEANPNPNPSQPQSSDRVCPVCNRDYSHVTMEEFQTHVFQCFDDNDGPETMKADEPPPPPDRSCPMCNRKFPGDMPQHEFEAHVHSHFVEESYHVVHRD